LAVLFGLVASYGASFGISMLNILISAVVVVLAIYT
jgi:hypothetical protein